MTIHALPAREDRLRTRVAAEVRAWRGRLQISQTAMAKTLSLSQASISDRLNGKSAFTLDEIETPEVAQLPQIGTTAQLDQG